MAGGKGCMYYILIYYTERMHNAGGVPCGRVMHLYVVDRKSRL